MKKALILMIIAVIILGNITGVALASETDYEKVERETREYLKTEMVNRLDPKNYTKATIDGDTVKIEMCISEFKDGYDTANIAVLLSRNNNTVYNLEVAKLIIEKGKTSTVEFDIGYLRGISDRLTLEVIEDTGPYEENRVMYTYYYVCVDIINNNGKWEFNHGETYIQTFITLQYAINNERFDKGNSRESLSELELKVSDEVTAGLTREYDKARALFEWVNVNYYYNHQYAITNKLGNTKLEMLEDGTIRGKGVCQHIAQLLNKLLVGQGIRACYAVDEQFNHAFTCAWVDGRWMILDPGFGISVYSENGEWEKDEEVSYSGFDMRLDKRRVSYIENRNLKRSSTDERDIMSTTTQADVVIDGSKIYFDAYSINNENYFKIRDLAAALNGTNAQFNVYWNNEKSSVEIVDNSGYDFIGGELNSAGFRQIRFARRTVSSIFINGEKIEMVVYNINGSNYFRLRDIAEKLDFGVEWNGEDRVIDINTNVGYTK